jgi:hypothetical protein
LQVTVAWVSQASIEGTTLEEEMGGMLAFHFGDGMSTVATLFQRKRSLKVRARPALLWKSAGSPDFGQIGHHSSSSLGVRFRLYSAAILLLLLAVTGKGAPTSDSSLRTPGSAAAANAHFAIADFDGDSQPDLATVQFGQVLASHARYWIHFQLSSGGRQFIGVTAPVGGLELALRDVNGDQNLDLIVTTAWLKRPVAVLLNDGHGNFTLCDSAAFPTAISGREASCSAANLGIADATAVFPRAGADCEQGKTVSSIPRASRTMRFALAQPLACWSSWSVFERGPPSRVNHV